MKNNSFITIGFSVMNHLHCGQLQVTVMVSGAVISVKV